MSSGRAVQMFGLEVPANDEPTPIIEFGDYPATIRLTMAALNPLEKVEGAGPDEFKGAVLKIIRIPDDDDSEDEDEDDYDDDMAHLLDEDESDEDEATEEDTKPTKANKVAALKAAINGDSMDVDGAVAKKGKKSKAESVKEEEDDDEDLEDMEDDDEELPEPEEFILCTLDTKQVCTQVQLR
jgi:FK506-binding nuclear protein